MMVKERYLFVALLGGCLLQALAIGAWMAFSHPGRKHLEEGGATSAQIAGLEHRVPEQVARLVAEQMKARAEAVAPSALPTADLMARVTGLEARLRKTAASASTNAARLAELSAELQVSIAERRKQREANQHTLELRAKKTSLSTESVGANLAI